MEEVGEKVALRSKREIDAPQRTTAKGSEREGEETVDEYQS